MVLVIVMSNVETRPPLFPFFKKAIKIDKKYARAHYLLGICYVIKKNHDLAINEYKILMEIDKDLAEQLFELIFDK